MTKPLTEKQYLKTYNIHDFDIPLTTVDMAIFTLIAGQLQVLMIKRAQHPALGKWALPGGFIDLKKDKTLSDTARRKLKEKTGVDVPYLEQVETIGSATRDPRGWSVTIVYLALIASEDIDLDRDESSETVTWIPIEKVSELDLAFDHRDVLQVCYRRLRSKVHYTSLPTNLLPAEFTLTELQKTFEIILGKTVEKKSFRRRILDAGILEETGAMKTGANRPAKLYRVMPEGEKYFFSRSIEGER